MKDLVKLFIYAAVLGLIAYYLPNIETINPIVLNTVINMPVSIESNRGVPAERDISTNADKVYVYLREKGLTHIQTCAIMGNIAQESGFDEKCIEEGNGIGFGLIQWSFDRRTNLFSYCDNPYDVFQQLDFLMYELDNQWTHSQDIFNNTNDLVEATKAFCWGFERPNIRYANETYRIEMAKYYFNLYQ